MIKADFTIQVKLTVPAENVGVISDEIKKQMVRIFKIDPKQVEVKFNTEVR